MGFDSNGNWSSDFYPINDRDNSVPILASKFQTLIQTNLKQSFENCILRDGTGKPTANINWNGQKITNLANGTNQGDAVNKGQLDSAVATPASEEQVGTLRISTEAEALAGSDDTTAMSPAKVKAVIQTLATDTRFAVNSGYASNGKPDLLYDVTTTEVAFNVDDGTSYKPLTATTASGNTFSLTSVNSIDVSALPNGTYNVFIDSEGNSYAYVNTIYRQESEPASMNTNDIWFNTCEPFSAYIKTSSELIDCFLVQVPQTITVTNNVVSSIQTIAYFNDNGNGNDRVSQYEYIKHGLFVDWSKGQDIVKPYGAGNIFTAPTDGMCVFTMARMDGYVRIFVNGNYTGLHVHNADDNDELDWYPIQLWVEKGDYVYFDTDPSRYYEGKFFPFKGVI